MAGFTGSTKTMQNIPSDVAPLRQQLAGALGKQGFDWLSPNAPDISPFLQLFSQQNAQNLAQAKESAGNLTGTGYGNRLGAATQRADVEQGAFLANLLEQSRQANANRLASILSPFLNAGVAPPQQVYQPGFLDYATQGLAGAAGAAGSLGWKPFGH
jgi:hypothetical protein